MGVSVWTFLRSKPGEIFPVAQRAMDDFLDNTGRLPADEEGFVRYAQVIVNLENRRAVEILRIGLIVVSVRFFERRRTLTACDSGTMTASAQRT